MDTDCFCDKYLHKIHQNHYLGKKNQHCLPLGRCCWQGTSQVQFCSKVSLISNTVQIISNIIYSQESNDVF